MRNFSICTIKSIRAILPCFCRFIANCTISFYLFSAHLAGNLVSSTIGVDRSVVDNVLRFFLFYCFLSFPLQFVNKSVQSPQRFTNLGMKIRNLKPVRPGSSIFPVRILKTDCVFGGLTVSEWLEGKNNNESKTMESIRSSVFSHITTVVAHMLSENRIILALNCSHLPAVYNRKETYLV